MKETDLFMPVKLWLEESGWDVFAEVTGVGGRADVVGKHGIAKLNVELKAQLSFELLDQAIYRKKYFHYVYIAIPKRKAPLPRLAEDILNKEGVGHLEVHDGCVRVKTPARFNRPPFHDRIKWENVLRSEYKSHIGGDNGSHILTPYKILMRQIRNYLVSVRKADNSRSVHGGIRNYGWVSIDDILDHCEAHHHYKSPKPSVSKVLRSHEMDWCEIKKESGKLLFRAKNEVTFE